MTYTYEIVQDTNPENPRREWDNAAYMICWHRRYNLGDDKDVPYEGAPEDFEEWARENDVIYLPLYLYDHSGITMRTTPFADRWDSGQVGYIYMTPERIIEEKLDTEKCYELMRSEVAIYDQYISGEIYGYIIKEDGEKVDSLWGLYGREYAEEQARKMIEYIEKITPKQLDLL